MSPSKTLLRKYGAYLPNDTDYQARWILDEMSFSEYENVLDNRLKEPDLHAPILHHRLETGVRRTKRPGISGARIVEQSGS